MRPPWSCWMTPTSSRRPPSAAAAPAAFACVAALALSACQPTAPPGVNQDDLDAEIARAIGDPATCVVIGKAGSGKLLYRYNSTTVCERELPACDAPGLIRVGKLLEKTAQDRQARQSSCNTQADASRGVGWAAGPVAGTDLVYAAVMEGDRAFPGRMIGDRLEGVFRRSKVSKTP